MSRYFQNPLSAGQLQYFGDENPFNNPNLQTYYAANNGMMGPTPLRVEPYRGEPYGGGKGRVAPRGSHNVIATNRPLGDGRDDAIYEYNPDGSIKSIKGKRGYGTQREVPPEYLSENYDQDGYYKGARPGTNGEGPQVDQRQNEQGGDRDYIQGEIGILRDLLERYSDPDYLRAQLEAQEPYQVRIAQRKHRMGLENIEAAGKAAFNYKYGPQMMMTAAASRAAYYPEMVRAATDSFTGLNLANAMKPRMSGYFSGAYRG